MQDLTELYAKAIAQVAREAAQRVKKDHPDFTLPESREKQLAFANQSWETWRDAFLAELAKPSAQPETPKRAYQIIKCKNGKIAVIAPYNVVANAEYKRLMGTWGRVDDKPAWLFDASHLDHLKAYLDTMFPLADQLQAVVITFQLAHAINGEPFTETDDAPAIDGVTLLGFSRDHVGRVSHPAVLEILENTLAHGGSARYPRLSGSLKVRARIRHGAALTFGNHGEAIVA